MATDVLGSVLSGLTEGVRDILVPAAQGSILLRQKRDLLADEYAMKEKLEQAKALPASRVKSLYEGDVSGTDLLSGEGLDTYQAGLKERMNMAEKSDTQSRIDQRADERYDRQLETERRKQENETLSKNQTSVLNRFQSDQSVKKSQQMIDGAKIVEDMANSGNPIAAASIPTFLARTSGEVGALTEADKAPFGGSRALDERLKAIAKQWTNGQITESNKKFILDLTATMKRRANQNIKDLARKRAKQSSKIKFHGTEDELYSILTGDLEDDVSTETGLGSELGKETRTLVEQGSGFKIYKR